MRAINEQAQLVLRNLISRLKVGDTKVVDNSGPWILGVHTVRLTERTVKISHYKKSSVCSPCITFWKDDDNKWYPIHFEEGASSQKSVELTEDKNPQLLDERMQNDQAAFAERWLVNIKQQQKI